MIVLADGSCLCRDSSDVSLAHEEGASLFTYEAGVLYYTIHDAHRMAAPHRDHETRPYRTRDCKLHRGDVWQENRTTLTLVCGYSIDNIEYPAQGR
jgi:hypothetical protein